MKVFGKVAAVTGWNERRLRSAGRRFIAIHAHAAQSGYYPGAEPTAFKLLVDPASYGILGAQAVGGAGVDKRIDVLATAIHAGLPAPELVDLELGYAPHSVRPRTPSICSAISPRTGSTATKARPNTTNGPTPAAGAALIDARSPAEYAAGHIPRAANSPLDELRKRRRELEQLAPPSSDLIVYCQVGRRAHTAAKRLMSWGYNVANLDGGYLTWSASYPRPASGREAAGLKKWPVVSLLFGHPAITCGRRCPNLVGPAHTAGDPSSAALA